MRKSNDWVVIGFSLPLSQPKKNNTVEMMIGAGNLCPPAFYRYPLIWQDALIDRSNGFEQWSSIAWMVNGSSTDE